MVREHRRLTFAIVVVCATIVLLTVATRSGQAAMMGRVSRTSSSSSSSSSTGTTSSPEYQMDMAMVAPGAPPMPSDAPPMFAKSRAASVGFAEAGGNSAGFRGDVPPSSDAGSVSEALPDGKRMILLDGYLRIYVNDVPTAERQVRELVESKGGHVANLFTSTPRWDHPQLLDVEMHLRVPTEMFLQYVEDIKSMATYVSEIQMNSQDVSEEYVDIHARTQDMEASRDSLLRLMERATDVNDILNVQRELRQITSELESLKARLNYLSRSATLSKLRVTLSLDPSKYPQQVQEPPKPPPTWTPLVPIQAAFELLGDILFVITNALIFAVVVTIPVLLLLGVVYSCLRCCGVRLGSGRHGSNAAAAVPESVPLIQRS